VKLVADTNVLVSGILWDGPPARLLDAALSGGARLFVSPALRQELSEVLNRPKFAERLRVSNTSADTLVARLVGACHEIAPARILPPEGLRDPDDSHVLACAVAAGADAVVSGDRDLLALGTFGGIPIIDVGAALGMLPPAQP